MQNKLGLTGRCGFALLGISVVALPIAFLSKAIDFGTYSAVAILWLLVSAALIFGDSITEITLWKASIKRDVTAARAARDEVEAIRDQLRKVSATSVENTYIISGELLLLVQTLCSPHDVESLKSSPGMQRLVRNMNDVWRFVEPDELKAELLRKQFRKELGMPDQ
ncbi:hypothetical protein [Pseudomonas kribbensis]|uniref:hypothetical protein n=1 Tax=Pseudomonas kribbensis TaxID=1628086 RepID=UPI001F1D78D7|nr:hypothetical protein [Pseudomonas kribbensis]UIN53574.1 hypothetical protein LXN51_21820 [Pseudomonas kribbensis]